MKSRLMAQIADLRKQQDALRESLPLIYVHEYDLAESCAVCRAKVEKEDLILESIYDLQCQIDDLEESLYQIEVVEVDQEFGHMSKIMDQAKSGFCFSDLLSGKWVA